MNHSHEAASDNHKQFMDSGNVSRRRMLKQSGAAIAALGVFGSGFGTARATQVDQENKLYLPLVTAEEPVKPVIVLCHGAWADGNSWAHVITRLQDNAYTVIAPAVNLQSVAADVASVRKVIMNIGVPVLVAGHSYGGAVMSGAATGLANVKGLVYIAAYAPDKDETTLGLNGRFDAEFGPSELGHALRPDGPLDDPTTLIYLDRGEFRSVFAQDVDPYEAEVMASTQRPAAGAGFVEPFPVTAAWHEFRTWYQVSAGDRVIQPGGQRWMAQRMGAETIELDASHVSLVSRPREVANFIMHAAEAVT